MSVDYKNQFEKYKGAKTAKGRFLFAILFAIPNSPYYNKQEYEERINDLAKTEPLAHYHLFVTNMIKRDYVKAFEHFKMHDPYVFGYGANYPQNTELAEWCLLKDWTLYNTFKKEILYFSRKTRDLYAECQLCTATSYRFCTHYELNRIDIIILNILRIKAFSFNCPICYENRPWERKCSCYDTTGSICVICIYKYEQDSFKNAVTCAICKNYWCKNCDPLIEKCPFCRAGRGHITNAT